MIGVGIKLARQKKGFTQDDLLDRIKVSQTHLSEIENNKRKPSMDLLDKISKSLELPIAVIFWLGINEDEVDSDKVEIFNMLKPSVDNLMQEMFKI